MSSVPSTLPWGAAATLLPRSHAAAQGSFVWGGKLVAVLHLPARAFTPGPVLQV